MGEPRTAHHKLPTNGGLFFHVAFCEAKDRTGENNQNRFPLPIHNSNGKQSITEQR